MFCVFVECLPGITRPGCLRRLKSKVRGRGGKGHNQLTPPRPTILIGPSLLPVKTEHFESVGGGEISWLACPSANYYP